MSYAVNPLGARLGIRGTFECRDATGAVVKTLELSGSVPLEDLGLTAEQQQQLVAAAQTPQQERPSENGTDLRQ